jgi:hypothetical protein
MNVAVGRADRRLFSLGNIHGELHTGANCKSLVRGHRVMTDVVWDLRRKRLIRVILSRLLVIWLQSRQKALCQEIVPVTGVYRGCVPGYIQKMGQSPDLPPIPKHGLYPARFPPLPGRRSRDLRDLTTVGYNTTHPSSQISSQHTKARHIVICSNSLEGHQGVQRRWGYLSKLLSFFITIFLASLSDCSDKHVTKEAAAALIVVTVQATAAV